jgi:hypothetical protein
VSANLTVRAVARAHRCERKAPYSLHSMMRMPRPGHGMDRADASLGPARCGIQIAAPAICLVVRYLIREILMRGHVVGLLAVAIMCGSGVAGATPIVYNVNVSDSVETISGTITTDGVIGTLVASDITAWSLSSNGPVAFSINSSIAGSAFGCAVTCGLIASPTTLVYVFTFAEGFFFSGPGGVNANVIEFAGGQTTVVSGNNIHNINLNSPSVIGRAVPEPGTVTLLGLALACLGFGRKRSRGQQSTAV